MNVTMKLNDRSDMCLQINVQPKHAFESACLSCHWDSVSYFVFICFSVTVLSTSKTTKNTYLENLIMITNYNPHEMNKRLSFVTCFLWLVCAGWCGLTTPAWLQIQTSIVKNYVTWGVFKPNRDFWFNKMKKTNFKKWKLIYV